MASFSVVIPAFNRAHLLAATLDSLLAQTLPFDRVILVDDGSTDDTRALVAQRYPACTYLWQPNGERQRARNAGAAATDSDWIVFCDSDDLLEPGYLAQVAALIAAQPQVEVIYCDLAWFGPDQHAAASRFAQAPPAYWHGIADAGAAYIARPGELLARQLRFPVLWATGLAIRRALFTAIGGWDERLAGVRGEDLEFTLRAIAAGNVGVLKAPLARYRRPGPGAGICPTRQAEGELQVLRFCLAHHAMPALRAPLEAAIRHQQHVCFYESCKAGKLDHARRFAGVLRQDRTRPGERLKMLALLLPDALARLVFRLWHALPRPAPGARRGDAGGSTHPADAASAKDA